jgi:hypothetical protein
VDNTIEVTLPFLMNFKEHMSVGGFLLEHFEGHQDVSHGLFSAGSIEYGPPQCKVAPDEQTTATGRGQPAVQVQDAEAGKYLQIAVHIWLAPFDFGITQQLVIAFCEASGDPGFLEIRVQLARLAGEANVWRRINKAFLDDIRKQILIWRSLDDEAKKEYADLMISRAEGRQISV